jgi:hypothetical protein
VNSPLQNLIKLGVVPQVTYPTNSRYYGLGTLTFVGPDGRSFSYLVRRIVPQPGPPNYTTLSKHTVRQGDRLDLIAAKCIGDPLMFWLLCDANGAIEPDKLVETPGTVLNITTPLGVTGTTHAG